MAPALTNGVHAATGGQTQLLVNGAYYKGQADTLQHQNDVLVMVVILLGSLLLLSAATILYLMCQNRKQTMNTPNPSPDKTANNRRWWCAVLLWALYIGGLYGLYRWAAPDWQRVLMGTLILQSVVALVAILALCRPRFIRNTQPEP